MDFDSKGRSPFYPGQPVPIDFFTGRVEQIQKIRRALKQTELGKQQALYLSGEYGIGKSSLAVFTKFLAEKENHLLGIYVLLGNITSVEELSIKTVQTIIQEDSIKQTTSEKIRNFLSKYIGKQELFGVTINLEVLKNDSLSITKGFHSFFIEIYNKTKVDGYRGILLIFDEINGITKNPDFSLFIKTIIDSNAISSKNIPLALILCGTEERRVEMVKCHQPVERIFEIVDINRMSNDEAKEFFIKTFNSVNISIDEDALELMCHYSSGFPKIMHIIGDSIFWSDSDNKISFADAQIGIIKAAEEIGRKFVNDQVLKALHSKEYKSILDKVVESPELGFKKAEIEKKLSPSERKKFHNFLQRMKKLNVIKSGERGFYEFSNRMIPLYLFLNKLNKTNKK